MLLCVLLTSACIKSGTAPNLIWACADESSNADDMVDILELVPETLRAAINAHLDSMNSLYPIRSVVPLLLAFVANSQGWYRRSLQQGCLQYMQKLLAAANDVLGKVPS